jgi:glycine/D-amino acid oxidase-like deaminating enzyme
MRTKMDVIIVGGGILGCSTAFWLARHGVQVALFDSGHMGHGDTAASAAIVRMHYTNPTVVRMALRAREIFANWQSLVGGEDVFTPSGWLFLVPPKDARQAQLNVRMQRGEGVDVEEVDYAFLATKFRSAISSGIGAIYYEPSSGYANPVASCRGLASAAQRQGAIVLEKQAIGSLIREKGRTVGVVCEGGDEVRANIVVVAAGAGSIALAAQAGHQLPMQCSREQEIVVADPGDLAPSCAISSMIDRIYGRPYASGGTTQAFLVGRGYPKEYEYVDPANYRRNLDPEFESELRERIAERSPRLAAAHRVNGYAALYDITPDWHPLLGPVGTDNGLWIAAGGSGHGFKLGPAIGEMVAGVIVGKPTTYASMSDFSVDRFTTGRIFKSTFGANRA